MAKSTLQRLVDSGLQISEMSRQQAESVVRQLVKAGEVQRRDAEELVQKLLELGRETTFRMAEQVEAELVRQVRQLSSRLDDLETRLESLTRQSRDAAAASVEAPPEPAPARKKKSTQGGKKASGGKKPSGGKKASGGKKGSTPENGGVGQAPRRPPAPAVGASGVRRIATTRAARDAD